LILSLPSSFNLLLILLKHFEPLNEWDTYLQKYLKLYQIV